MACEAFISYCMDFFKSNQAETDLDFSDLKEKLVLITPRKLKISPDDDLRSISCRMRDAIVSNFAINQHFIKCSNFKFSIFTNLYNLLVATAHLVKNDQFAQLVFMIHISKSDIDTREEWSNFLLSFNSINLVENKNDELMNMVQDLFEVIKKKDLITNTIRQSVLEITKRNDLDFHLNIFLENTLTLNLFKSKIRGIRGFAGINSIYVSYDHLLKFYKLSGFHFAKGIVSSILKLEIIRIYIHEVSHVVIRKFLNDINISTPSLETNGNKIKEAGVHSEKKFFGQRIDWFASAIYKHLNQKYCLNFLETILKGQKASFDLNASKCIENTSRIYLTAIDYIKPSSAQLEI